MKSRFRGSLYFRGIFFSFLFYSYFEYKSAFIYAISFVKYHIMIAIGVWLELLLAVRATLVVN